MIPLLFNQSFKTLFATIEREKNLPCNSVLLSSENYTELLTRILKWLEEEKVYQISKWKNPKAYFSFHVSFKGKNKSHTKIMITYPKKFDPKNTLVIGWGWKLESQDKKAFKAVKDTELKKRLIHSITNKITAAKVSINVDTDYIYLEGMTVYRYLGVDKVTKNNIIQNIELLIKMWRLVMRQFKQYNMHGGSFKPSEHV